MIMCLIILLSLVITLIITVFCKTDFMFYSITIDWTIDWWSKSSEKDLLMSHRESQGCFTWIFFPPSVLLLLVSGFLFIWFMNLCFPHLIIALPALLELVFLVLCFPCSVFCVLVQLCHSPPSIFCLFIVAVSPFPLSECIPCFPSLIFQLFTVFSLLLELLLPFGITLNSQMNVSFSV